MTVKAGADRREFLRTAGRLLAAGALAPIADSPAGIASSPPPESPARVPVLDCHAHAGISSLPGRADGLTDPWAALEPFPLAASNPAATHGAAPVNPEGIIRRAEQVGIDRTMICPIQNITYDKANEEIAGICRKYPGKFIGFAIHDSVLEAGHLRESVYREVKELGLRGLGELYGQTPPTPELLDLARELNLPVLYHPHGGPHGEESVSRFWECVPGYPTVNFILAHLGSDQSDDWHQHVAAIELAKRHPNVYVDTSSVLLTGYLDKAIRELPPEKIIFGSDEPEGDARLEIYKIRMLKLPKEREDLILGGNLLRLLGGRI
ncbi:MAG: amidohydrolase family protein [Terriglobia bacterium]